MGQLVNRILLTIQDEGKSEIYATFVAHDSGARAILLLQPPIKVGQCF